jgi:ribose transport system substrate-binding protein
MKRFSPLFAVLGATTALSLVLTGCNSPSEPETASSNSAPAAGTPGNAPTADTAPAPVPTVAPGTKVKVAFVTNNPSPFWEIARNGCEKADAELPDLTYEFRNNSAKTPQGQKEILDDLVAKGVNGIAISPNKPDMQIDMLNATAEKTLLITQDSDAANSKRAFYIGTDNHAAGVQAGELLKKALPNGGDVMVFVGDKDAQNAQDRYKGIQDAIAGTKIKILDLRLDGAKREICKDNASDTLAKYPDISALVGLWSYNGPALLEAVKGAKKVGKVKIVCFDEEKETLDGVRNGEIVGTVVQQPYEFGYQSVKLMNDALHGKMPAKTLNYVKTLKIEKDSVDAFEKQLNLRLGKK